MAENYSIGDTTSWQTAYIRPRRLSSKQNIAMARLVIRILALLFTWQAISIEGKFNSKTGKRAVATLLT